MEHYLAPPFLVSSLHLVLHVDTELVAPGEGVLQPASVRGGVLGRVFHVHVDLVYRAAITCVMIHPRVLTYNQPSTSHTGELTLVLGKKQLVVSCKRTYSLPTLLKDTKTYVSC